jgi:geranylgeranyl reductase family protein
LLGEVTLTYEITPMKNLVIVGGGPSGAYLAYLLAKNGVEVTIFDDSHPREKPCGGGISPRALKMFPILAHIPHSKRIVKSLILISPRNKEVLLKETSTRMNISRLYLDRYLLNKAINEGAEIIEERVIDAKQKDDKWILKTNRNIIKAKGIVGADGTKSIIRRRVVGDIPTKHLAFCKGYLVKGIEKEYNLIKFLGKGRSCIWIFPRENHTSVGVSMDTKQFKDIPHQLNEFIKLRYPHVSIISKWSALIPQVKDTNFYKIPCAGKNWILIGDAAGHVDPITGEGILYALWSAEVAHEAIANKNLKLFDKLWREEYGKDLIMGVRLSRLFYYPLFLDLSIRMIPISRTYLQMINDTIISQQRYRALIRRSISSIPAITFDLLKIK